VLEREREREREGERDRREREREREMKRGSEKESSGVKRSQADSSGRRLQSHIGEKSVHFGVSRTCQGNE
jgi:hypothetical protein